LIGTTERHLPYGITQCYLAVATRHKGTRPLFCSVPSADVTFYFDLFFNFGHNIVLTQPSLSCYLHVQTNRVGMIWRTFYLRQGERSELMEIKRSFFSVYVCLCTTVTQHA